MSEVVRGSVYHCPHCGAEVAVLSRKTGEFKPMCCNVPMVLTSRKLQFYVCPSCGAEVASISKGSETFHPRCCNEDMKLTA